MADRGLELAERIAKHPVGVRNLVAPGQEQGEYREMLAAIWPPRVGQGSALDPPTTAAALAAAVDANRPE